MWTFHDDDALVVRNVGDSTAALSVNELNNVFDFAELPTVNGTPLAEAHRGIQRITTNLPHHSYRLVHDSRQYWVYINTNVAVPNNISIHLRGQQVATIDKVDADNLHLGVGDNLFLITLSTNEISSWNTNTISTTPNTQGFEIQDSSGNRIEGIHDQNQFFTGRGEVSETFNLISPDRTQTATITLDNDGTSYSAHQYAHQT